MLPRMKIEDRLAQLERLVEAVATAVPARALPYEYGGNRACQIVSYWDVPDGARWASQRH